MEVTESSNTKALISFSALPTFVCSTSYAANTSPPGQKEAWLPQVQEASHLLALPQDVEHVDEAEVSPSSQDWVRGQGGRSEEEEETRGKSIFEQGLFD
ncbi:unnamed protein product [Phytophthora lilii]|uniref:Unnamed protein product n=1 Tax=Phytophthora lilii TaxID=2077276 RepID=A0A9W6XG35_9STRA|nr:unnamed protein product [Phytophthora lilii]